MHDMQDRDDNFPCLWSLLDRSVHLYPYFYRLFGEFNSNLSNLLAIFQHLCNHNFDSDHMFSFIIVIIVVIVGEVFVSLPKEYFRPVTYN